LSRYSLSNFALIPAMLLCGSVPGCALRHWRQSITAAWLRHSDGGVCQYRNSQQAEQVFLFDIADRPRVNRRRPQGLSSSGAMVFAPPAWVRW
jgi:hypothetical protein